MNIVLSTHEEFLSWLQARLHIDAIDILLAPAEFPLAGLPVGPRLAPLAWSYEFLGLSALRWEGYSDYIPFLLKLGENLSVPAWLAAIGVECPADRVLQDLRAGGEKNREPLLWALRPGILNACFDRARGLFKSLIALGVNPGMRVGLLAPDRDGAFQAAFENAVRPLMKLQIHGYYAALDESAPCQARTEAMRMLHPRGVQWKEFEL